MRSFHECGETLVHALSFDARDTTRTVMDMELEDPCWICLEEVVKPGEEQQQLVAPCRCPRKVHPRCLARWQLQQAGRAEETHCRFCKSALADWKASLTPETLKPDVERVQPIMVVYFEGEIHRIPVKQGNQGLQEFTNRIRELFRLPEDVDISLTFGCKEPMSGHHLKLEGIGAFDAAVHCASVAAAERQHKIRSSGGGSVVNRVGSLHGPGLSSASPGGGHCTQAIGRAASTSPSPCFSSSPTVSHGGRNHLSTTHLRHSTGSSFPPPAHPPAAAAATSLHASAEPATASSPCLPSSPARGRQARHSCSSGVRASAPSTLLQKDEELLLQQHLQQLSHSIYSQHDFAVYRQQDAPERPDPPVAPPPPPPQQQQQPAPSTSDAPARAAVSLPAPSPRCAAAAAPAPAPAPSTSRSASSDTTFADSASSELMQLPSSSSQDSDMTSASASPSGSVLGDTAHAPLPGACASSRRACRSSSSIAGSPPPPPPLPPPPCVPFQQAKPDGGDAVKDRRGSGDEALPEPRQSKLCRMRAALIRSLPASLRRGSATKSHQQR